MSIPDFTIVVAIDRLHLAEMRLAYPTWLKFHPELADRPMVVICDGDCRPDDRPERLAKSATVHWWDAINDIFSRHVGEISPIFTSDNGRHIGQREKMLSAFVLQAPKRINTPYYLKIDSDTICTAGGEIDGWIDPAWFVDDPVIIAPPWGYTKPGAMIDQLHYWAAGIPHLAKFKSPLVRHSGNIAKHRRVISYCMFGHTAWTREMAGLCHKDRLPVPSQDTFLWYMAQRTKRLWRGVKMPGWRHIGGGGLRLRVAAEEAMKSEAVLR